MIQMQDITVGCFLRFELRHSDIDRIFLCLYTVGGWDVDGILFSRRLRRLSVLSHADDK